jgi:signal transduction histidine kinase
MVLDIPTLAILTGFISLLQFIGLWVLWFLNRNLPGLGHWTTCSLLNGLSLLLIVGRLGLDNDLLTMVLPTLLAWTGSVFFHSGAAALQGKRASLKWPLFACIPCFACYIWFGWFAEEFWLRPLFYTSPIVLFLTLGALDLFRERRRGLRLVARFTGCATMGNALSFVLRGGMLTSSQANPEPFQDSGVQILIFASTLLWILCWTFATVLLVNQSQNIEKMAFHDAQLKASELLAQKERELGFAERELAEERIHRQRALLLRDLHDGLGGVTANLVLLASLGRSEQTSPERNELMQHIEHLAVECNREVRLLMDALQQGSVDWRQFLQELREYAKHLAAGHRFSLHWRVSGYLPAEPITDLAAQLSLMRCLKEAVNNMARHSGAREATIRVRFLSRCLGVTVRDDGIGLQNFNETARTGRGLRNMLRRCEELGGRLTLRSSCGTVLRFFVPLPVNLVPMAKKTPFPKLASMPTRPDLSKG